MWSREIFRATPDSQSPKFLGSQDPDSLEKIWKSVKILNFLREEHIFVEFLITITQKLHRIS